MISNKTPIVSSSRGDQSLFEILELGQRNDVENVVSIRSNHSVVLLTCSVSAALRDNAVIESNLESAVCSAHDTSASDETTDDDRLQDCHKIIEYKIIYVFVSLP